jgi:hypothetical protein
MYELGQVFGVLLFIGVLVVLFRSTSGPTR